LNKEISIYEIITTILRKWWLVLIFTILFAAASFTYYNFFVEKLYSSYGKMYVASNTERTTQNININDLNTSRNLVNTYAAVFKGDTFLNYIISKLDLDMTSGQLSEKIVFQSVNNTEVMSIKVTTNDPLLSKRICQAILDNANDEVERVIKAGSVSIIDNASTPVSPSYPDVPSSTLIGGLIGFALSIALILLLDMLDNRVKSEQDLTERYNIPVLGLIPNIEYSDKL